MDLGIEMMFVFYGRTTFRYDYYKGKKVSNGVNQKKYLKALEQVLKK